MCAQFARRSIIRYPSVEQEEERVGEASVAARGQRLLSRFTALYICAASIVESVCFHTGLYDNKPTVDRAPPILVPLFSCREFAAQV